MTGAPVANLRGDGPNENGEKMPRLPRSSSFLRIVLVALASDQMLKLWARGHLLPCGGRFPGLSLCLSQNRGIAFGLFRERGLFLGLLGFALLVVSTALFLCSSERTSSDEEVRMRERTTMPSSEAKRSSFLLPGLALLWGGALGNVADRILFGAVTDYLRIALPFRLFGGALSLNLADGWIILGALLLFAVHLRFPRNIEPARDGREPRQSFPRKR